jgi:hypothetical protein
VGVENIDVMFGDQFPDSGYSAPVAPRSAGHEFNAEALCARVVGYLGMGKARIAEDTHQAAASEPAQRSCLRH